MFSNFVHFSRAGVKQKIVIMTNVNVDVSLFISHRSPSYPNGHDQKHQYNQRLTDVMQSNVMQC